ncbi:MAG: cytochrome c biogenesis protein CcdA [Magnetococcus sp. DMHC-6]
MENISLFAALLAGLLSFVSPCVLPLVPAYISFMTGLSVDQMRADGAEGNRGSMWKMGVYSLFFIFGFSLVFIALGASATYLGKLLLSQMALLSKVGGVLIVVFGLHYMGLFRIGLLNMEARFYPQKQTTGPQKKPPGVWGAFLIGLAFAFGWTPCVGPILAAILALAGGQGTVGEGILLLAVYSAGLGIPFLLAGLAINTFFSFFVGIRQHLHKIEKVSGILLVAVGGMILLGNLNHLSILLLEWFPSLAGIG